MKFIILLFVLALASCELQDTEKNDYDHTQEYLNTRCDLDGEVRYYPSDSGGYCMRCEFSTWKAFDCSDFPRE